MSDHRLVDATPTDFQTKGLKSNAVGLTASTTIALASTAPAFSLAATIGYLALSVGEQSPAVLMLAFIPMLFVAIAYRELNKVMPDAGTSFTWATKAFGPWIGWMAGWGLAITGVIFVANAADVVGIYLLGLFDRPDLASNTLVVSVIGVAFIAAMTWINYRGIEGGAKLQYFLVGFQYLVLVGLAVLAIVAVVRGNAFADASSFSWSWFNPFDIESWSAFAQAFLLAVFIYWGWDTALAINEETADSTKTPGRAAVLATLLLVALYVFFTTAMTAYAGVGETGLGNPDKSDDIFTVVAEPLLGSSGTPIVLLAVLLSTAASLQTTIMPTSRGTLAMAVYKAAPKRFGAVSPKFQTPTFSTILMGVVGSVFFVGLKLVSDNVLQDTVLSIGLGIAFYYSITAFACVWWFRKEAFLSVRNATIKFVLPLIGGLVLAWAFVKSAMDMLSPDYGNTSLFGVGGVFIVGVGSLAVGVVLMLVYSAIAPPFFRGQTLHKDTPVLVPDE